MPRSKKQITEDVPVDVEVAKGFVYELQIFVAGQGIYYLKDTVNKTFKEELSKLTNTYKEGDSMVIERYTLIGAPKSWFK